MRKISHRAGPRAISNFLGKSTRAALVKRGFAQADILSKWGTIVGPTLARASSPERLSYSREKNRDATLKVRVTPGFAPEFQQFEPLIIERINSFFGFRAVGRLQLIQAPVIIPEERVKQPLPPPTETQKRWIEETVNSVDDPELKQNLRDLGAALVGRQNKNLK